MRRSAELRPPFYVDQNVREIQVLRGVASPTPDLRLLMHAIYLVECTNANANDASTWAVLCDRFTTT